MRIIVYGIGAVGGIVAGMLARSGEKVLAIARGRMLDALKRAPLHVSFVDHEYDQTLDVVGAPGEIGFAPGDVVLLCMKAQDTQDAFAALKATAPADTPVVSMQNGVANEPLLAQHFRNVYGVVVQIPCRYMTPGHVEAYCQPAPAIADIGRYPSGVDALAREIAARFDRAGIESRALPDIMRWKYQKLLVNLCNAIEATSVEAFHDQRLKALVRDEGRAVLRAAGIDAASDAEDYARRGDRQILKPIKGVAREGGSTWQSLARGRPLETDHLTGEIVRLATAHGAPAPLNTYFLALLRELARTGAPPGSFPAARIYRELAPFLGERLTGS
ncbi:MAG: ketopantoate reductase family protein [Alphaproteobacteria bacterium]